MFQTGKGCRQPEGRVSAGAWRITGAGKHSKKGEFGVTAEPRKEASAGVQQRLFCVWLAMTSRQQEWEISTLVFLARNISVQSSASSEIPHFSGHLWPGKLEAEGKLKAFLVHLFRAKTLALD